jgi:hypothetical protein
MLIRSSKTLQIQTQLGLNFEFERTALWDLVSTANSVESSTVTCKKKRYCLINIELVGGTVSPRNGISQLKLRMSPSYRL